MLLNMVSRYSLMHSYVLEYEYCLTKGRLIFIESIDKLNIIENSSRIIMFEFLVSGLVCKDILYMFSQIELIKTNDEYH